MQVPPQSAMLTDADSCATSASEAAELLGHRPEAEPFRRWYFGMFGIAALLTIGTGLVMLLPAPLRPAPVKATRSAVQLLDEESNPNFEKHAGTGCANWKGIALGKAVKLDSAAQCQAECLATPGCNYCNYQPAACSGTAQTGPNRCYLFAGNCTKENNTCWDLYEATSAKPFPFESPKKGTGCENWKELSIGTVKTVWNEYECGGLCEKEEACAQFNFQPDPCPGKRQAGKGACYLFKEGCKQEDNVCWDLYPSAPVTARPIPVRFSNYGSEIGWRLQVSAVIGGVQYDGLMVDTGSSNLALCESYPSERAPTDIKLTPALYNGSKTGFCLAGYGCPGCHGWIGEAFHGSVGLGDRIARDITVANITIEEGLSTNECGLPGPGAVGAVPMDGIWGFAYTSLAEKLSPWPEGGFKFTGTVYTTSFECSPKPTQVDIDVAPWRQFMREMGAYGRFGIHWKGSFGPESEMLVGEDAQTLATQSSRGVKVAQQACPWYCIQISLVEVIDATGKSVVTATAPAVTPDVNPSIVDTGTPSITIPGLAADYIIDNCGGGNQCTLTLRYWVTLAGDGPDFGNEGYLTMAYGPDTQDLFYLEPDAKRITIGLTVWNFYPYVFFDDDRTIEFFPATV